MAATTSKERHVAFVVPRFARQRALNGKQVKGLRCPRNGKPAAIPTDGTPSRQTTGRPRPGR